MRPATTLAVVSVTVAAVIHTVTVIGAYQLDGTAPAPEPSRGEHAFPRTVSVPGGARITLSHAPQRIVPTTARALDLCAVLVDPERLVAIPADALEYATLGAIADEVSRITPFREYAAEALLPIRPDLVVADPWQSADTHERLERAGVPVLVLPEATTVTEVLELTRVVGRVLGSERRARAHCATVLERIADLARRTAEREPLRVLAYSNFGAQGYSAGRGTTLHEALALAGLENAFVDTGLEGHQTVEYETLLALDPEAFVVSEPLRAPSGPSGDRGGAAETLLRTEPALRSLRAVREGRFLRLPPGLYASASHGVVDAAEELARQAEAWVESERSP